MDEHVFHPRLRQNVMSHAEVAYQFNLLVKGIEVEDLGTQQLTPSLLGRIRLILDGLDAFIPGLEYHPINDFEAELAYEAALDDFEHRKFWAATQNICHGLQISWHHPQLWHLLGCLARRLQYTGLAERCFYHAVWINPGFLEARRDLLATSQLHPPQQLF